jgi:4-aminobutyrate--pyruvate transaminase
VSSRLQDGIRKFADHPLVGEVRGIGMFTGIDLVKDKKTKEMFPASAGVGTFFERRALHHGLILRGRGDTLVLSPPLIITDAEIDELLARFARALDETGAMVKAQA